jgi:hypothetical protein
MSGEPLTEFVPFPKLARLSREMIVTEKLDGTNAQLIVTDDFDLLTASRNKMITPADDNHGFATWAQAHRDDLITALGPGRHFGEWWGSSINKRYRLGKKCFSLFNTTRWGSLYPSVGTEDSLLHVVPVLYHGMFDTGMVDEALRLLQEQGSRAVPGCMDAEGVIVFHVAGNVMFKKTLKGDEHKEFVPKAGGTKELTRLTEEAGGYDKERK